MAKFEPGQSGNKGGRPKVAGRIREIAQKHAEKAIEILIGIANDVNEKGTVRVAAADHILNRALGRPEQGISLEGAGGEAIIPNIQIILTKREQ